MDTIVINKENRFSSLRSKECDKIIITGDGYRNVSLDNVTGNNLLCDCEYAELKAKEVVVLSVLPVREDEFPSQNWLDEDMWCFNSDIINFNENVRLLCNKYNVQFFDVYNKFILYEG